MKRILKAYLKRLTNLSTRNKSLLLSTLPQEQFIDLHSLAFLLEKDSFDLIRQLLQRKPKIPLCDVQDPRFEKVNEASKRLRKISRTERFIEEERGAKDLYVGFPFIKGKLADGTPIHAPLLYFPVTLGVEKEQWCLLARDEEGISLNRSFALAYGHFNDTPVPDAVLERSFEDFSKDVLEFRTQLYEWLKETPFRINFNQDLFEDKLTTFDVQRASELAKVEKNGELKLFPEAVLGIFPQAGSYLVPDYEHLIEQDAPDAMVLLGPEPDDAEHDVDAQIKVIAVVKEEELLTPFLVDESQEEIIRAVKTGKSVVVQGPPGSGKSQLICNLMADFAARGKRVLLVCQKRAALDVVYQRLQSIGMQPFTALIHDFKNDRAALYQQIALQIDQVEDYRQRNYSLDAVFIERQFIQESRSIDKGVQQLDGFRSALFDETDCGESIKELYLRSNPNEPAIAVESLYRQFRPNEWEAFRRQLHGYAAYALLIGPTHPWFSRRDFSAFDLNDLRTMEKMLQDWPDACLKIRGRYADITGEDPNSLSFGDTLEISERLQDIVAGLGKSQPTFDLFRKYLQNPAKAHERVAYIRQRAEALTGFLEEDGVEFFVPTSELHHFRVMLKKAINAKQSAVSGLWWDMFSAEKKQIADVAKRNNLSTDPQSLSKLDIRLRNRIELESWLDSDLLDFTGSSVEEGRSEQEVTQFFQAASSAADASARAILKGWSEVIQKLAFNETSVSGFTERLGPLDEWLSWWERARQAMSPFLLPAQITKLLDEPVTYSQGLSETLHTDFDSLVEMDRLAKEMSSSELVLSKTLLEEASKHKLASADKIVALFENSVRLSWINHIENKHPDLRAVTSLKMEQWERQLQESIVQKQKLSSEIVGINLRENTYEDVEKNRLGNRVTYRELHHQVTKRRKIWPIRKMLEQHHAEAFSLIPCWMASPEAVSAVFPMDADLFDLVIFDEASQCYAEYGLPASLRGKQIVVTGDSKQLPPSDLYRVRFEDRAEDDEVPVALETESLLDLAAQTLDQYQLSGHYRSLSLDLIDFSNRHFYKDSLRLLPDFNKVNNQEPGIELIKVDGVWAQHINQVEVQEVVRLLHTLANTSQSVGVVTFNYFQQQAVQEAVERESLIVRDLFVKNIENVQGDERDVIIFTMGYAPDEKGKVSMQFGSLNMQGGENRLNVAVTRARSKIYFVTSLLPSQLQTDQTANAGPKILKAYLEYATEVSDGRYLPKPRKIAGYGSGRMLKDRLQTEHSDLRKELPFSDLTIKEGEIYKGLILTDDDLYHQSKSSKEPHAYLPLLLNAKNWPYQRVYSRSYWAGSADIKVP